MMLIKQVHRDSVIFGTIGIIFLYDSFKFQPNVCNRSHDLLIVSWNITKHKNPLLHIKIGKEIWPYLN